MTSTTGRAACAMSIPCGSGPDAAASLAAARRALGSATWTKTVSRDGSWLNLAGQLGGLHIELYAARDAVCTRVVTGTEVREVEVEVTPAVMEKVMKEVEVVEWECGSLLDPRGADREPATA